MKFWKQRRAAAENEGAPATAYFRKPKILTEAEQQRLNLERLMTLADVGDANPVWKTLVSYADEHAGNEQVAALEANLSDATRHYNAGRAASALDFAQALRDLRAAAVREARKMAKQD